jgi:MFS transporter, DHA1 family, tetracycline resistance protein
MRRVALFFVFAILIVDAIVASLLYPVYANFTDGLRHPALWFGVAMFMFSLFQLIAAPVLGALSDRIGRRPVFRVSAVGTFLANLLLLPVRYSLFVANRALDGSTNGLYGVVKSTIVDLSEEKDVQRNVGLSATISYVGLLLGPGVASGVLWLAKQQGWDTVRALVIAGIAFASVNVVLSFLLPETRPAHASVADDGLSLRTRVRAEVSPRLVVRRITELRRDLPEIAQLLLVEALVALCTGYYTYFAIFVARGPLKLDPQAISFVFLYFAGLGIVTNTIFFGRIAQWLRPVATLKVLFVLGIVTLAIYAATGDRLWVLYVALTIDMLTLSLAPGLLEGELGRRAPEARRGEIFGLGQGLASLMGLLSIVVYTVTALIDLRLPFAFFAIPLVGCLLALRRISEAAPVVRR